MTAFGIREDGDFERPKWTPLGVIRPVWREGARLGPSGFLTSKLVSLFVRLQLSLSGADLRHYVHYREHSTPFLCAFYHLVASN